MDCCGFLAFAIGYFFQSDVNFDLYRAQDERYRFVYSD